MVFSLHFLNMQINVVLAVTWSTIPHGGIYGTPVDEINVQVKSRSMSM